MTEIEYLNVCKKYEDYITLYGVFGHIKGIIRCASSQVTTFYTDRYDEGVASVWAECTIGDSGIYTKNNPRYATKNVKRFEQNILKYIKNYKQVKIDVKKLDIETDFK